MLQTAEYGSAKWKAKRCSCTTELMGRYRIQCGSSSLGPPELLMQDGVDLVVVEGEDSGPTSGGPGFHRCGVAEPVTPFPYRQDQSFAAFANSRCPAGFLSSTTTLATRRIVLSRQWQSAARILCYLPNIKFMGRDVVEFRCILLLDRILQCINHFTA